MDFNEAKLQALKEHFGKRDDIVFAILLGSAARNAIRIEGDVDIAVYFKPEKGIEWEDLNKRYEGENRIGLDMERLFNKDVDLIVLNRAKATLAGEIIRKGKLTGGAMRSWNPGRLRAFRIFASGNGGRRG